MIIRDATREDIDAALAEVNKLFNGNIRYRNIDLEGKTRSGGDRHRLTLTVNSSAGPGGRRSHSGRRIAAACWHVHGHFFDSLPEGCEITVASQDGKRKIQPGDPWEDRNIGSNWFPLYFSEACECNSYW